MLLDRNILVHDFTISNFVYFKIPCLFLFSFIMTELCNYSTERLKKHVESTNITYQDQQHSSSKCYISFLIWHMGANYTGRVEGEPEHDS